MTNCIICDRCKKILPEKLEKKEWFGLYVREVDETYWKWGNNYHLCKKCHKSTLKFINGGNINESSKRN